MNNRREGGRETWHRLLEWDQGQADSERLAARLLSTEGYSKIDPSHPLGGRDGKSDIVCEFLGNACKVGVYFPRYQQPFAAIQKKFLGDCTGDVQHFVFFTNQELRLSEREKLCEQTATATEIYHLERIAAALDTPKGYGLRLEYLKIQMTMEEQISFINHRDEEIRTLCELLKNRTECGPIKAVNTIDPFYFSLSDPFSKLKGCKCGAVFRAVNTNLSTNIQFVKCPDCGHMQTY